MAQNITLLGADYPDVPAVDLPKTGGGTATFTDVTDTTAVASDVAQGKYFYTASGVKTTGTGSGGGSITTEALSVTQNGTYTAPTGKAYTPVTVNVSGGGGSSGDDVVFIDYDGTVLHSYSKADVDAMSALPANPSHTGLTAQGWNWSLADIKSNLTSHPERKIFVGQMYITDDGKTRLYVHFDEGRSSPYLTLGVNGTVTIDWGDGSATETLTGTSLTSQYREQHVYQGGDYVITLTPTSGSFSIIGASNGSRILNKSTGSPDNSSRVYLNALKKVELGSNVSLGNYAFIYCFSLMAITIPNNANIGTFYYAFRYCYSLLSASIPSSVTNIDVQAFASCYSLVSVSIPNSVTSIGNNAFNMCYSLTTITIPSSVTTLGNNPFSSCYSLRSLILPDSVTTIGSNLISSCNAVQYVRLSKYMNSLATYICSGDLALREIEIPNGITSIGSYSFNGCNSLVSVSIPSSVTSIGANAFYNCHSLATITIPSSVTSIGANAFYNCYGMGEYHFLSTTPPTIDTNVFYSNPSDCKIYVPYSADHSILNAYKTATNWSAQASKIQEEPQ